MRIAVTGSNGFIGSGICSEAVRAGHVVLGISRSSTPAEDFGGEYLQADISTADLSGAISRFRSDVSVLPFPLQESRMRCFGPIEHGKLPTRERYSLFEPNYE